MKKTLKLFKYSFSLRLALGFATIVIGYLATMFYYDLKDLDNSVQSIANANRTQIELEHLLSSINNNETSLRSFIITKDSAYLKSNLVYRKGIIFHLKNLKELRKINPDFQNISDSLNQLIEKRFYLFDQTLKNINDNTYNEKLQNAIVLESSNYTYYFQSFVGKLLFDEAEKVIKENVNQKEAIQNLTETASILAILSIVLFLLSFFKMQTDLSKQKKTIEELKFLNETFNNAEKIAGFGHWEANMITGINAFSDNYYVVMGSVPGVFNTNIENVMQNVHPDDIDFVIKKNKEILISQQPETIIYRLLLKDGSVRYIKSVISFKENDKGEFIKIGVNHDITEYYTNTIKLSENNQKLIDSNADLESFNSIVSHDLQEPLRKVQMFISRLEDNDLVNLTDQGKEYFNKIRASANRMQNLLIDLANYAKAVKDYKLLKVTDLNHVLSDVIDDLSFAIEEKKAKVTVENLPTINAIPFQIQQLFFNLISNSLKYSKTNTIPKINIKEVAITSKDVHQGEKINPSNFYKIVLTDDGIGFKQEYAENIFILFKRLETEISYNGTGLGLAICKKIVENHNGFIKAFGEQNVGAQFIIYLPKEITVNT